MSLCGMYDTAATLFHRDTDTRSASGEVTPAYEDVGTAIEIGFQEGMPAWAQDIFGMALEVDAIAFVDPSVDVRPDPEGEDGLADKLVIGSTDWLVMGAGDQGGRGKVTMVALRRFA